MSVQVGRQKNDGLPHSVLSGRFILYHQSVDSSCLVGGNPSGEDPLEILFGIIGQKVKLFCIIIGREVAAPSVRRISA